VSNHKLIPKSKSQTLNQKFQIWIIKKIKAILQKLKPLTKDDRFHKYETLNKT
jgi:hypothetical protein